MGAVGWGKTFNNIENWKLNPNLNFVKTLTAPSQILSQAPWLMNLLVNLPGADGPLYPYATWIKGQIQEKLKQPEVGADAMSKIVHSKEDLSMAALFSEGELMVIAGGSAFPHPIPFPSFQQRNQNPELTHSLVTPPPQPFPQLFSTWPELPCCSKSSRPSSTSRSRIRRMRMSFTDQSRRFAI